MKDQVEKIVRYGDEIWSNVEMEKLRESECLCLNCKHINRCAQANTLDSMSRHCNMRVMVTQCIWFKQKLKE